MANAPLQPPAPGSNILGLSLKVVDGLGTRFLKLQIL
jgi:hypothetical protein